MVSGLVPEPERDHRKIDAGVKQLHAVVCCRTCDYEIKGDTNRIRQVTRMLDGTTRWCPLHLVKRDTVLKCLCDVRLLDLVAVGKAGDGSRDTDRPGDPAGG